MKNLTLSFVLFLSIFSFSNLFAQAEGLQEKHMVKIISEPENNLVHNFILLLDSNNDVVELMRRSKNDTQKFTLEALLEKDQVLMRASDRDVIILQCPNCDAVQGGDIGIKYLRNGMSMTYKTFHMTLRRNGDDWELHSVKNPVKIHTLRIKTRKLFGQMVGIKKIIVNK